MLLFVVLNSHELIFEMLRLDISNAVNQLYLALLDEILLSPCKLYDYVRQLTAVFLYNQVSDEIFFLFAELLAVSNKHHLVDRMPDFHKLELSFVIRCTRIYWQLLFIVVSIAF